MEGPRFVPSGNVRIEAVNVSFSSTLGDVRKRTFHRAFNPAGRRVSKAFRLLPAFLNGEECVGFVAEQPFRFLLQSRFIRRIDRVQEFPARVPGHHHGVHAFPRPVKCDRIADTEPVVLNRKEGHMALHVFFIAPLQLHCVHPPGFLQGLHAQETEEILPLLFRVFQQFRPADLPAHVGVENHRAHHGRVPEQPFVVRAGQLAHHAAAAGGLSCDRHLCRIPAEGRNVPLYPAQPRLLVQVAEVGRCVRRLLRYLRMC